MKIIFGLVLYFAFVLFIARFIAFGTSSTVEKIK